MSLTRTFFAVGIAAVAVLGIRVAAHHGAASFDTTRELMLKGTVTEWIWANPHCFLKFDAKDDTGTVRNWVVETGNPTDISRSGYARLSFKPGHGDSYAAAGEERRARGTHQKRAAAQRPETGTAGAGTASRSASSELVRRTRTC